ncbi:MAG: hypothetical protein JNM21_12610 [Taibaiella sp.]|nr:hypothetical protein [Taibaiella sp.]
MSYPRLRIFAGPNGSGKSTLYEAFAKKYDAGKFLNADLIENELSVKGFIDLDDYNLSLSQEDLTSFYKTERASSLIQKSIDEHYKIDIHIEENMIVDVEKEVHSYEGALISTFLRHHFQRNRLDYCFETVMSHPSKIDEVIEAKQNNYKAYLYFICIDDPEVNISRVGNRVQKGGHNVNPDKISSRYYSTLKNLISMIENIDKCYLFDNSGAAFKLIAKISGKGLQLEVGPEDFPNWFIEYVLKYYQE